jgi:hypothetical protein
MKADLTRSTDRPDRHYRAVRMQQGRVQLDAEWNEQQEILNRRIETETLDTLGAGAAVPIDHAGFQLTGSGKNVTIGAGRAYVNGLLCEATPGLTVIAQPALSPAVSPVVPEGANLLALPPANAAALTEIKVYDAAGAAVAPADGLYIGYIEAWLRHVTALEDPLIREVALGVPDTTTRDQLAWQVKLLRAGALTDPISCITDEPWNTYIAAPDGTFAARAEPSVPPKGPCLLTPEAGYRRLENQLYRVEIHDDGSVSGKVRYKWSRDNGSIATRVTRWLGEPTANEFEVASIGQDATLAITAGCWLEFYDDTHDELGQPGGLVQVLKTAGNVVTVDLATKVGALDKALYLENPRVRRWENWAQMAPTAPNTATGWVELEDGIEVKFTPGRYRLGDFWMVPARTTSADIEWPLDAPNKPRFVPPQGVRRSFARLAVLRCQSGNWTTVSDCRHLFPALGELTNLYYVGGDGQQAMPNLIAPVNVALPQPLEVAVFNGQFPVAGAQVRFTASDGVLSNGTATQTVTTGADGVASVIWRIAPKPASQTCTALLLDAGAPAAGKFNHIDFSAGTLTAAQVAYNPANCVAASAAGIDNVQDALDALCKTEHAAGCCMTVGEGGEFPTLDVAIRELLKRNVRYLCLCLLPGEHKFADGLDVEAPEGTHLHVHGAGMASRLVLRDQAFNLSDFASVSLENFEVQWTRGWALLQLYFCTRVRLVQLGLSGFTVKGQSLLKIGGSMAVDISGCRINGYAGEKLPDHQKQLFALASSLSPLVPAMSVDDGRVFAPIDSKIILGYSLISDAQRKQMSTELTELMRKGQTGEFPLGAEEMAALARLNADIQSKAQVPVLFATLEDLRVGVLLSQGGASVALLDSVADTLLADNRFNGALSLYGDSSGSGANDDLLGLVSAGLKSGRISIAAGRGLMRLRNNRLRGVRFGAELVKRLRLLTQSGGAIDGCYRSLVADSNTMAAEQMTLLAFDASLGTTCFEMNSDVGTVVAAQGKYLGNFAHNDFRLFAVGHTPEHFGNGALNIVQM